MTVTVSMHFVNELFRGLPNSTLPPARYLERVGISPFLLSAPHGRVTVEDCVDKVPNRFELVMLASHRAREIAAGDPLTVDRDNDKNPVVSLREIADETQGADDLRERLIESLQTQIEVDEPEEDAMALLQGVEQDRPAADDMSEEQMLRALMEAQGQK